jgi:hypothetical protein
LVTCNLLPEHSIRRQKVTHLRILTDEGASFAEKRMATKLLSVAHRRIAGTLVAAAGLVRM